MGAHNELTIAGITELREALRRLPADLSKEAGAIVFAAASAAYQEMDSQYAAHEVTGNLRRGLQLTTTDEYLRYGSVAVLKNHAPHAWWAENGTQMRRTSKGVSRGAMAPLHIFIPTAQRHRRRMVQTLIGLVERAGFIVSATETELAA
jgi:hypothetical protein